MRFRSPASRASFAIRFAAFDVMWALVTPWLALWIRGVQISSRDISTPVIYCMIAFAFSLAAFLTFRIREGMSPLFSVHDALEVAKAVLAAEVITFIVLFSMTRLDGIPRSTPLIHALLLAAGLVMARAYVRMSHSEQEMPVPNGKQQSEHILVIGSNKLSALYIDLLRAYAPDQYRVIALLDDRPEMAGRSIAGIRVLGPALHLLPVIEEFREHGIRTDRVIIGGNSDFLTKEAMAEVEDICNDLNLQLDFIPQLIGLDALQASSTDPEAQQGPAAMAAFRLPRYFRLKRYIDFTLSLLLIILLLPLFILIAAVVLLDVGSPVFFWQRRLGMNAQSFQMHKFRTLKPAYDWRGIPVTATNRVSWVGNILRKLRLDELPQLLNVLVGDMSLIGPRPLLPHDQPRDPTLRLMVRPGITGWAQVNGGKLLTAEEKNEYDEWYVRHASLWLDIAILAKTILFMLKGERTDIPLSSGLTKKARS